MKSSSFLFFLQTIISYQVTITLAFSPSPSRAVTTSRSSPLSIGSLFSLLPPSQKKSITKERIKEIKDEIKTLSKGTSNGISASEEVRSQISTLVTELEASNPTPNLTKSEKLDGSWKLIYTTNEGSSAGKLGPFVGEVEQFIRIKGYEREDYINYVRIGGGLVEGALTATWDVLSKNKWQVNFESVKFKLFGITLADKELSAVGIWRMTYLDENFRILYAAGGKNVPKENIYILGKEIYTLCRIISHIPRNEPLLLHRSSEQNTETRKEKKEILLHLLSKVPRNVSTPKELSSGILSSVRELEQLCPTNDDNVLDELGGNWELIWTAQDSSTEESRRGTFLKYINPLENQAYSINPIQNDAADAGTGTNQSASMKVKDNTQIMGRSNPILPQSIQNTLEDLNIIQIEEDTKTSRVVSSQAIDLKKRRVRNVVSFQINNPFAKQSLSTIQGIITVDVNFRPNPTDPRKVDVKFSACRFKLSNFDIQVPLGIFGPTGWLRTSYIDDDIRITRGHKGSVFILNRTASKYQ